MNFPKFSPAAQKMEIEYPESGPVLKNRDQDFKIKSLILYIPTNRCIPCSHT